MDLEQQRKYRWYTYLYKNITWKEATAWRKTLLVDGRASDKSEEFVKIVNFIKEQHFPHLYTNKKFLQ